MRIKAAFLIAFQSKRGVKFNRFAVVLDVYFSAKVAIRNPLFHEQKAIKPIGIPN